MKVRELSETTKYTLYGALFGLCFPVGAGIFAYLLGAADHATGLAAIARLHAGQPLLYVIDSAPLFLGLFARLAGVRQDRIRRFSEALERQVAEKTESLRRALEDARRANEHIAHLAGHDPLTGLLNRRRFQEELAHWVDHATRYQRSLALIFIDLDNFKLVNDTHGHGAGDEHLVATAEMLRKTLRSTDYLARWGGDEFAILLPETGAEAAVEIANKLMRLFNARQTPVASAASASAGIALFPTHTTSARELVAFADAAMYQAKQSGRNCWRMYAASNGEVERAQEHIRWEGRLRRALEADQFVLLYQPLLSLATGETSNYEALLRMEDRDGQLIGPGLFLGHAEECNLSTAIDRLVVRKAAHRLAGLGREHRDLWLSLNLSRKTVLDTGFIDFVREVTGETGVDPARLGFEISEQVALEGLGRMRDLVAGFRGLGSRLILDDFGLGFSSLNYLQQLPVSLIKIEGGLIRRLKDSVESRRFVRTLCAMAHDLGIEVAAKFVEDAELLAILQEAEVDYAQGFAIGRPLESLEQLAQIGRLA